MVDLELSVKFMSTVDTTAYFTGEPSPTQHRHFGYFRFAKKSSAAI